MIISKIFSCEICNRNEFDMNDLEKSEKHLEELENYTKKIN